MITFTETTGILNQDDIRRKTRIWQFDASSGKVKRTWWISDAEFKCDEEDYDNSIPLTINTFTNRYLDASVGRCAALNGAENFVLMADGGWDKPLHDGDMVGLVPAVGFAWMVVFYVIMAVMMVYCIYMIATMKTGDGAGSTTVYSLSSMTNSKRPGEIVERQYGRLKRMPSYAANPYTLYKKNKQILYAIFCLNYDKIDVEEIGLEDTKMSEYTGISYKICTPGQSADLFDNNIVSSSEVSGGLTLYAPNQNKVEAIGWNYDNNGKYCGWFTANKIGTVASALYFDVEWQSGIYAKDNKGRWKTDNPSRIEIQYRTMTKSDSGVVYGTPVTVIKTKNQLKATTAQRVTHIINVAPAAYQCRMRRLNNIDKFEIHDGAGQSETKWTALRARLPNKQSFPKVTTLMMMAPAQSGLSDSAAKRFYVKGTGYSPIYNTTTKVWTDTPNRNPVWAACDMLRSSNGGNYPDSMLALDHLASWAAWCDTNQVYFDYCFDDQSDIDTQMKVALRVMRASPIYTNGQFHILRDEQVTIPTEIFTTANIVKDSLKIQYKGRSADDYDGLRVEYADSDDEWNTNTVDCLLAGSTGSNVKTTTMKGCCDRTHAYRLGMYEWSTEMENRAAISFTSTKIGWQCEPGAMIYLNHPMFRQHDAGRIIAIDGTTVTLDRNVNLNSEYNNIFLIRNCKTGGELGRYVATYTTEGDYHTLTLDSAPDATGMEFDDPQALPTFALGIATNFAKKCRVTKTQNKTEGTDIECFVDTDARFAYDSAYPDTDIPSKPPAVIPAAPNNVTAAPSSISVNTNTFACVTEEGAASVFNPTTGEVLLTLSSISAITSAFDAVTGTTYLISQDYTHLLRLHNGTLEVISGVTFTQASRLAISNSSEIYIIDSGAGSIVQYSIATNVAVTVASGLTSPTLACLLGNKLYFVASVVANWNDSVLCLDLTTYSVTEVFRDSVGGLIFNSFGLVTDGTYLYALPVLYSEENIEITKIDVLTNTASILTTHSGISGNGLTYYDGHLYVTSSGFGVNTVKRYTTSGLLVNTQSFDGPVTLLLNDDLSVVSLYDGSSPGVYSYDPDNVVAHRLIAGYNNTFDLFECRIPISVTDLSSITIAWDAVSGFDTYIVQYSQDGETWTTLSGSMTATSALVGSYLTGYFYARVAVVHDGCVWSWGESAATLMPSSTLSFVYVTSDNFIDTTSDGYKMVFQGES